MKPKSKAALRGPIRRLAIVGSPPQKMEAVVISSTTARVVVLLPKWSERVAIVIPKGDPQFPGACGRLPNPAVNLRYTCEVKLDEDVPRIIGWSPEPPDSDLPHMPTPHVPPRGVPGPPDLLPILNHRAHAKALGKVIDDCVAPRKLSEHQREGLVYLVRRAYGQGMSRGMRDRT